MRLGWMSEDQRDASTRYVDERTWCRVDLFAWCGFVWSGGGLVVCFVSRRFSALLYHGQMACFDAAVTTMWLAVALAWLYREGHHIRLGLVFGLAIATKHNVLFFPILLLFHWLWIHRERLFGGFRAAEADGADGWALTHHSLVGCLWV